LGSTLYLSALSQVDGVVGNSSSGLTEAPSFRIGTIDIGDRQRGRLKADSVISCQPIKESIMAAISEMYSPAFQDRLKSVVNPYGDGGAADRIVNVLATISLDGILKKQFHDLVVS
jgi:GDP/UDP-N,N'-diacetylbacillosamine 2-epimerase (hydrolysing)